jgi:hypothetical protein
MEKRPEKLFNVYFSFEREVENFMNVNWYGSKCELHGWNSPVSREWDNPQHPTWFRDAMKKCKTSREARKNITKLIEWAVSQWPNSIKETEEKIDDYLNKNTPKYIKTIEKTFGFPFPFRGITVYLTHVFNCPMLYEEKAFTLILDKKHFDEVVIHELNHFAFCYYVDKNEIPNKFKGDRWTVLMEAFTVLTNPNEKGYKTGLVFREKIRKLAEQKTPFDKILEIMINSKEFKDIKDFEIYDGFSKMGIRDRFNWFFHECRKLFADAKRLKITGKLES